MTESSPYPFFTQQHQEEEELANTVKYEALTAAVVHVVVVITAAATNRISSVLTWTSMSKAYKKMQSEARYHLSLIHI